MVLLEFGGAIDGGYFCKNKECSLSCQTLKKIFNGYVRLECIITFHVNTKYFVEICYVVQNQENTLVSL